jgi:tRNA-2-methylthio-N6-dimethylallyladenosine synthase
MPGLTRRLPDEQIRRQYEFMHKVRDLHTLSMQKKNPLAYTDTYGCQQNEADTELLRGMCREMGYELTENEDDADLVIVNTCAVRKHAEMRALGNIGALSHVKRRNPGLVIAVCGCMAQREEAKERLKRAFLMSILYSAHIISGASPRCCTES